MRADRFGLSLLAVAAAAWAGAIATRSWLLFGLGLAAFVGSIVAPGPRHVRRLLPSAWIGLPLLALLGLLALNQALRAVAPSGGEGHGWSVEGGAFAALALGGAALATAAALWWAMWRGIPRDGSRWQSGVFLGALLVFLLAPAVFAAASPKAESDPSTIEHDNAAFQVVLGAMAGSALVAAALPHGATALRRGGAPSMRVEEWREVWHAGRGEPVESGRPPRIADGSPFRLTVTHPASLLLVLVSTILAWVALAAESPWPVVAALLAWLLAFLVPGQRFVRRVVPPRRWTTGAFALLGLVAVSVVASTLNIAAPGPGRGLSIGGGTLPAALLVAALIALVIMAWWVVWLAMGREAPAWQRTAYVGALFVFLASPAVFYAGVAVQNQAEPEPPAGPDAPQPSEFPFYFALFLAATSFGAASALPFLATPTPAGRSPAGGAGPGAAVRLRLT